MRKRGTSMKLVVEIDEATYKDIKKNKIYSSIYDVPLESVNAIANGTPLEAFERLKERACALDKIRAEILECLNALDEIEKSGFNIYLPNEMSGRRLTYKQCLEFIDKYKEDSEPQERENE